MHIVEYCVSNLAHGTEETFRKLEELPDVELMEYGCLDHCNDCLLFPYALVNGEMVAAETAESLYAKIVETIRKHEAERAALDKLLDDL
jgi:uncharacterized protein YuzB (UPF0349 family)